MTTLKRLLLDLIKPDPSQAKQFSEEWLHARELKVCDWLPVLDHTTPRKSNAIAARALILNAIVQIYFQAPIDFIAEWIHTNRLASHLSSYEAKLLTRKREDLSDQELTNLLWLIEALWALMWIGGRVPNLPPTQPARENLASMFPSIREKKSAQPSYRTFKRRSYSEMFHMLDLYYRIHWLARDNSLKGLDTGPISLDAVMERRRALEWAIDESSNWDNIDLST